MSAGQVAADALLERQGRTPPPPPPARTAVASGDRECARCGATGTRLVPPYWAPDRVRLCPPCCQAIDAEYGPDERSWPAAGRWTPTRTEPGAAA